MIEFWLQEREDSRASATLIAFATLAAFVDYVRRVGEVKIVAKSADNLVMVKPNAEQRKR